MLTASLLRRTVVLFLLLAVLISPWAVSAAGPQAEDRGPANVIEQGSLFSLFWSSLQNFWGKAGCHIDPDGLCVPPPAPQPKIGCLVDPWGRCLKAQPSQPKIGCNIDPDGRCLP